MTLAELARLHNNQMTLHSAWSLMSLVRRCLLPETRQGKSEEGKSTEETVADLDEITVPRAKGSTCGKGLANVCSSPSYGG